jgi:hypothetical protein
MQRKLYQHIASRLIAIENCKKAGNSEWQERHQASIDWLVREHMPSGSGIDNGTHFRASDSTAEKLVFATSFHHMDEYGGYDGWTDHTITVRPSLYHGIVLAISGRDRNEIKDYLYEVFYGALDQEIDDADPRLAAAAA